MTGIGEFSVTRGELAGVGASIVVLIERKTRERIIEGMEELIDLQISAGPVALSIWHIRFRSKADNVKN